MKNRDEGSYQLSLIYDNLFASNLSGERRLDRPFRRRPVEVETSTLM